ncbi:IS200/IS605 family transposase [Sphaerochaeta halotolerans]|uniref:IS200/IS605 family transposase n=1 Tax=Sphaerochaeta halotolerans TaxID=2293840 RepID=UPI001368CF50|nr:IS200/IS605 family transposase [Sphaerochaeta halotolerans]
MVHHVHLFVSSTPAYAPQFVVNQLKGFTSRTLRQRRRWLRSRLPKLWTRSYYIGSVGAVSSDTVSNFIPQRSERKGISMMVPLTSECREKRQRIQSPGLALRY